MDDLIQKMKEVLATSFSFYLKAHNYHWNVEGPNFSDYHAFLGTLYTEVWGAVDLIAEHLRTLDAYAPGSYKRFSKLSRIEDEINIPHAIEMLNRLKIDNSKLIEVLTETQKLADQAGKVGLSNFLQDRIDIHEKHGWMLRSITKAST